MFKIILKKTIKFFTRETITEFCKYLFEQKFGFQVNYKNIFKSEKIYDEVYHIEGNSQFMKKIFLNEVKKFQELDDIDFTESSWYLIDNLLEEVLIN